MEINFVKILLLSIFIVFLSCDKEETTKEKSVVKYNISFENAVHHEAEVNITFADISADTFAFKMPRSSPGRYAIHGLLKTCTM